MWPIGRSVGLSIVCVVDWWLMCVVKATREMIIFGMCYKRGHMRKNWSMRLLVLDGGKLLEYDTYCDPHTAMQLGLIDRILTTADVVPLPPLPPPSAPQVEAMADDEKAGGAAAAVV